MLLPEKKFPGSDESELKGRSVTANVTVREAHTADGQGEGGRDGGLQPVRCSPVNSLIAGPINKFEFSNFLQ